jgi:hypothetical protein
MIFARWVKWAEEEVVAVVAEEGMVVEEVFLLKI